MGRQFLLCRVCHVALNKTEQKGQIKTELRAALTLNTTKSAWLPLWGQWVKMGIAELFWTLAGILDDMRGPSLSSLVSPASLELATSVAASHHFFSRAVYSQRHKAWAHTDSVSTFTLCYSTLCACYPLLVTAFDPEVTKVSTQQKKQLETYGNHKECVYV